MSNITISNESLSFLQKHRHASFAHPRNLKPFVSFVQDSEDSDSDRSSVMLTPKLQEHTRYVDRRTFENGITPVKLNLSKRFTNAASVTPSKIYQLASEVSEEEGSSSSKNIKENTTKKNSRSHSKSYIGRGKDLPKSPDYDMDSIVEAPKRSRITRSPGLGHKHKRSSNKQIPEASEEENEEPPKLRRRRTSKPEQVFQSLSPQPKLKPPGRPSVHADSNSIDMVIESVVRASPFKRQNESPSKVSKKTMADEVRKQTAKRGSKSKSLKANVEGSVLNDTRESGAAVRSGIYPDSTSVPPKNSESDGGERRTRRKALPTSASRLEFDWNCSSEDAPVKTPKKGPRSNSKEGSRKRTRSSSRLTYQLDSTEDEANQQVNKSNAVFKTPPAVENRPQVSKTPSSVKPLSLLSAAFYTASEDENTQSTEVESPSDENQNIRTPIGSDAKLTGDRIFSPNRSARKTTVVVSPNKAAENPIQSQGPAGTNVQTTPKSILKPSSSEGANASPMIQNHPQKSSVTTLTSLEIVSPVRTSSVRTESMTSTMASFELISSPAREIPISSPGVETCHISKSVMPAQGGIKRKYSALPTSSNTKRSRQQMDVNRQSESTSRDLAIESSETTSWDVEAGRSTTMPQQVLIPRIEANRLNPYASTAGDPLSTKQLLQSNEYRISYLELLPECFFSLRAHCKTSIVIVAGTVTIHCREPSTEKVLDVVHRFVDLVPGSLYHLQNSGDVVAHFQMIESLQDWID